MSGYTNRKVSGFLYANHVIKRQSGGSGLSVASKCFHHKRCTILTWQIRNLTAVDASYQRLGVVRKREWVWRRKPKRSKVQYVVWMVWFAMALTLGIPEIFGGVSCFAYTCVLLKLDGQLINRCVYLRSEHTMVQICLFKACLDAWKSSTMVISACAFNMSSTIWYHISSIELQ